MIRINLLGVSKPKKGKRGGGPVMTVEGPSIMVTASVLILLTLGGSFYWYSRVQAQHKQLQTKLETANRRIQALSIVKTKYEEKDKQAKMLQKRFDVIDQLRAAQAGPVDMLAALSNTINESDAVWLNSMKDDGNNVTLDGVALSNIALANYMTNLKKDGYFKSVELKETLQDDYKDIQAFSFVLVCEKTGKKKA